MAGLTDGLNEWKGDCKVRKWTGPGGPRSKESNGFARILEHALYPNATFWYGCVDILADDVPEWESLLHEDVVVNLEDGRAGVARVLNGHHEELFIAFGGMTPGRYFHL